MGGLLTVWVGALIVQLEGFWEFLEFLLRVSDMVYVIKCSNGVFLFITAFIYTMGKISDCKGLG